MDRGDPKQIIEAPQVKIAERSEDRMLKLGAQLGLASCYENGNGVEKELGEAARWDRMAAEQGYPEAQTELGHCYAAGDGVENNLAGAVAWYRKAADQGDAEAQLVLGVCCRDGVGIIQNY